MARIFRGARNIRRPAEHILLLNLPIRPCFLQSKMAS
jgi:hypothetical protein